MSLRNKIQNSVGKAFNGSLKDAAKRLTYIHIESIYDPILGETAIVEEEYITRGVIDKETVKEVFGESYQPKDVLVTILQNELAVVPNIHDRIQSNLTTWKIIAIKNDPVDATWELLCRK